MDLVEHFGSDFGTGRCLHLLCFESVCSPLLILRNRYKFTYLRILYFVIRYKAIVYASASYVLHNS
jgi:hypothetical protein